VLSLRRKPRALSKNIARNFPVILPTPTDICEEKTIPWKNDSKGTSITKLPAELYCLIPPRLSTDWTNSLPDAIRKDKDFEQMIEDSHRVYRGKWNQENSSGKQISPLR